MVTGLMTDPAVHRRRLRSELRKAREAAGMTQRDVARAMEWSLSKLLRIESGAVSISTNDLRVLLTHYGVADQPRVDELLKLARASRERSWWSIYRDVANPETISFLGFESSASIIRNFQPLLVPGLLQTEEYAREVIRTIEGPDVSGRRLSELLELRMERQDVLVREVAPHLHFIIDEAVIRRVVGGPEVMLRQLRHVRDAMEKPNTTVRVVPFSQGLYPAMRVGYVMFEFPDAEDENILYIENPRGEMIIRESSPEEEDEGTSVKYLEIFWELEQLAPKERAPAAIDDAIAVMSR
jgi:transcriptional regulator with XRE-family HTH domain